MDRVIQYQWGGYWTRPGAYAETSGGFPPQLLTVYATIEEGGKSRKLVEVPEPTPATAASAPVAPSVAPRASDTPPPSDALEINTDRFTGSQSVRLAADIQLSDGLEMNFLAVIPEKTTSREQMAILLRFDYTGQRWQYLDLHSLRLLIDGARVDLGETIHRGKVLSDARVIEHMHVSVDAKTFISIANGTRVEARLGGTEFTIPYPLRAGFRKFADSLSGFPSAPPP